MYISNTQITLQLPTKMEKKLRKGNLNENYRNIRLNNETAEKKQIKKKKTKEKKVSDKESK